MPEKVSLCMIVKDEEEFLPRCLKSAKKAVDEMIVVDTGSSDRTVEIANDLGARVIEAEWIDDFSAVRNIGLVEAKGDWILFLDADEKLESGAAAKIRKAIKNTEFEGFMLTVVNLEHKETRTGTEQTFPSPRLFRNRAQHRFKGAVHEQVTFDESKSGSIGTLPVNILHYGYIDEVKEGKGKSERNQRLLADSGWDEEQELVLSANEDMENGKMDAALDKYVRVYGLLVDKDRMHLPGIVQRIVYIHQTAGRSGDALEWAAKGLERWRDYTDLEYMRALTHIQDGDHEKAAVSFAACVLLGEAPPVYDTQPGVGSWRAFQGLGLAYMGLKNPYVAARAFSSALQINKKDALSAGNLGQIYLNAGNNPGEVETELAKLTDAEDPEIQDVFAQLFGGGVS